MAHRMSRCQFEFGTTRMVVCTLAACTIVWTTVTAGQERKAESDAAAALARRTLAAKLSVPAEEIKIVSLSPAQWRDSSLGCPERGMVYTPALTSGYEVKVRDSNREHVVHVSGGRAVVCSTQSDPKLPPAATISTSLKAADTVRKTLAARLGIEPARVRIVSTRPFRSSSISCPPLTTPPKGASSIVEAEASGQTFRYYIDDTHVVSCDK
jgi:hypothetical protein